MTSLFSTRAVRIGLLAVIAALVLVPTAARAKQRVERRDTTRLSIRHSWVGVTPPTKASLARSNAALVPAIAPRVEPIRVLALLPFDVHHALPEFRHESPEPLRGPPSGRS